MTAPTKASNSTSATTPARPANGEQPGPGTGRPGSGTTLEELARAQEELTHEIRQLVARQALDSATDDDRRERAGSLVTVARADLLEQLREQEQEQARRQLERATRSGEEAVAGVVRSVTMVVRTLVPTALVRPEDLIEAAYSVADQGLRVSRRLALGVSSGVRSLATAV
ncbi:hypothetical protein E4P39_05365 [Blastococcus sp. CT_GayMR19]|uniref:hypothetical protein n=1 Tax=Blastococcus sp. CT_GayMR19 TaxID=2559608 RepID=UPI0010740B2D|nr:hypothetical protein [Blastococcus sp. CT_GayMR19]TFV77412.1 hypothetical protein E4P39_05365 [Blastococcus sp. CT_GayMR19]